MSLGLLILAIPILVAVFAIWVWAPRTREDTPPPSNGPEFVPQFDPEPDVIPPPRGIRLAFTELRGHGPSRDHIAALVDRLVIGSDPSCGVALSDDPSIAPRHCELYREGQWFVVHDLKSPAGTFVNGGAVRDESKIVNDDILQVGATRLRFREDLPG